MKFFIYFPLFAATVLLSPLRAEACSCLKLEPEAIAQMYKDAAFIGEFEVVAIESLTDHADIAALLPADAKNNVLKIKPVSTLKGSLPDRGYVLDGGDVAQGDCSDEPLVQGQIYKKIIHQKNGVLSVDSMRCRRITDDIWAVFEKSSGATPSK